VQYEAKKRKLNSNNNEKNHDSRADLHNIKNFWDVELKHVLYSVLQCDSWTWTTATCSLQFQLHNTVFKTLHMHTQSLHSVVLCNVWSRIILSGFAMVPPSIAQRCHTK